MAGFLAAECALTLVLLAAVGVTTRQDLAAARGEFRVDGKRLLTSWVTLPAATYGTDDRRTAFYARLAERLAGLPGGVRVALTSALPGAGGAVQEIAVRGRSAPAAGESAPTALTIAVDGAYFAVTAVPVRGSGFGTTDGTGGPETAIVNERFVRLFLPDRNPIGEHVRLGPAGDGIWLQIVGVVPTIRQRGGLEPDPVVYRSLRGAAPSTVAIVAGADGDPTALSGPLRDALRELDPKLAAYRVMTLERAIQEARWSGRMSNLLLRSIALIGSVLSLVGLYAVTGHAARQRRRELGLLAALGARPGQLQWLILRRAMKPLAIGLLLGVGCVHAFDRLLGGAAAPIAMSDAATLVPLLAIVAVVAATACLVPARRAAYVDPVEALRSE
jgi:putative ABC transport system permease protein